MIVKIYSYSGNYIREIDIGDSNSYDKIVSDGIYLYISSSDVESGTIEVYTISGNFVRSISSPGVKSVSIKDGDIYAITSTKIKKYNSSGVFQSEFDIVGEVYDSVII